MGLFLHWTTGNGETLLFFQILMSVFFSSLVIGMLHVRTVWVLSIALAMMASLEMGSIALVSQCMPEME